VGVLVIYVLVFTVYFIVCTGFLYLSFKYIYSYLFCQYYCIYRLSIFILICFVSTTVRTTTTE
jgi:hypothetical protein